MHYKRIVLWSAFCFEYVCNGIFVVGVRSESVHRLGGKNHETAVSKYARAFVNAVFCFYDSCHISLRIFDCDCQPFVIFLRKVRYVAF